jgi:hypothetical protein
VVGKQARWKWVFLQSIHLLICFLTHAYLGAISAAFAGLIAGFHVLAHWPSYLKKTHRLGQIAVATIGPLVAYLALLKATDNSSLPNGSAVRILGQRFHMECRFVAQSWRPRCIATRVGLGT